MPGKLCDGKPEHNVQLMNSRSYCEGIQYRIGGTETERPKSGNPHDSGTQAERWNSWNLGWDQAEARKGNVLTRADVGCCAGEGVLVPADPA